MSHGLSTPTPRSAAADGAPPSGVLTPMECWAGPSPAPSHARSLAAELGDAVGPPRRPRAPDEGCSAGQTSDAEAEVAAADGAPAATDSQMPSGSDPVACAGASQWLQTDPLMAPPVPEYPHVGRALRLYCQQQGQRPEVCDRQRVAWAPVYCSGLCGAASGQAVA